MTVAAQQPAPPPAPQSPATPATPAPVPEISITGTVTARELTFHAEPSVTVEFFGHPERINVWEAVRTNIPTPVRPGETYRDVAVAFTIETRFADIEKFLVQLLAPVEPQPARALHPR